MSHCIATSIVIKDDKIIIKGGDNNVVPRHSYTVEVKRTPEDMRIFVKQDLMGGCIKPTPSANDYFWWWMMRRPMWERYQYETITIHELDRLMEEILMEWGLRRDRQHYAIMLFDLNGNRRGYLKPKRGLVIGSSEPVYMSMYKAVYIKHTYERQLTGYGYKAVIVHNP